MNLNKFKPKKGNVLILKVLPADLKAYNSFQWPEIGYVVAPDWEPSEECGKGLHGWLWGAGDTDVVSESVLNGEDSKWFILERSANGIIDLKGKVKFQDCEVRFCGDRKTAIEIMKLFAPSGTVLMFSTATAGYNGTATAGYNGTATAGDNGTATAGHNGTATAGDNGTATAGRYGTATAGDEGLIVIQYYDGEKYRRKMAMVDGVTILPGVKYRLNNAHEFEAVNETEA